MMYGNNGQKEAIMTKWVTTKEIQVIAECGYTKAQEIKREVNQIVADKGYKIVSNRKAPRQEVLKYLGLEDTK